MKAYACVYRHSMPRRLDRRLTEQGPRDDSMLRRYLDRYDAPDCFDDWGDDPSFFAATEILGSPDRATWGVCRRDVRASMTPGDFVVFFCGKETGTGRWDYFYVGVGTVGRLLDRHVIWADDDYEPYRRFFNILARPVDGILQPCETIHRFHPDWQERAEAPYIVFNPETTRFDLRSPLHVASYEREGGGVEVWRQDRAQVRRVAELILPDPPTRRGLRSINRYRPHPKMNLHRQAHRAGGFEALRAQLLDLVYGWQQR